MKLKYKIDEKKLLIVECWKDNLEHTKTYIENVINNSFDNKDNWQNINIEIDIQNKQWTQKFINNANGEVFYTSDKLPITIRMMFNRLFDRLYRQYCN